MRTLIGRIARLALAALALSVFIYQQAPTRVSAQGGAPRNFLPIGPPANLKPSAVPDLSGDWTPGRGGIGQSLSAADMNGRMRGKEPDIPYLPETLKKTMAYVPATGPEAKFETNTDPQIHYCEPPGPAHIYMWPAKHKFIQTPEAVYILHELGPVFQAVWLNAKHPEDPDPQYWGHSIGWYENGDTLVVDTIGLNDRTLLDQMGHPHTEQLHLVERYKRVSKTELELDITVDDPGAYAKPWTGHRNFRLSDTGFLRFQWVCSVRDNKEHFESVGRPANTGETTFK